VNTLSFQLSATLDGPPIVPTQPTAALLQTCVPSPVYSIDSVLTVAQLFGQISIRDTVGSF
jgi:hypothetical protein